MVTILGRFHVAAMIFRCDNKIPFLHVNMFIAMI